MFKITLGIDGMMCNMCEAHMNDAVRNKLNVKKVTSSHKDKSTVILSNENVSEEVARELVASAGYTLTSYESQPYEKKGLFSFGKK